MEIYWSLYVVKCAFVEGPSVDATTLEDVHGHLEDIVVAWRKRLQGPKCTNDAQAKELGCEVAIRENNFATIDKAKPTCQKRTLFLANKPYPCSRCAMKPSHPP